jgi:hypothetical protein
MKLAPKTTSPIRPLIHAEGLDVTQLNAKADSALPTGFQVQRLHTDGSAVEIYEWTGANWEDVFTLSEVTSTSVTGVVRFVNPSATDIDINW